MVQRALGCPRTGKFARANAVQRRVFVDLFGCPIRVRSAERSYAAMPRGAKRVSKAQARRLAAEAAYAVADAGAVPTKPGARGQSRDEPGTAVGLVDDGPSKAVRAWLESARDALSAKAAPRSTGSKGRGGGAARRRDREARERSVALSTTADTEGVSFAGRAFQRTYFESKFERRALLVYRILRAGTANAAAPGATSGGAGSDGVGRGFPGWQSVQEAFIAELTAAGSGKMGLSVLSVGGGPGTDAAGVVAANRDLLKFGRGALSIALLDYEPQWRAYTATLASQFAPDASVEFSTCDARLPLVDPTDVKAEAPSVSRVPWVNARIAELTPSADLILACYVVHETSAAAARGDWAMWRGIASHARVGAIIVLTDVQARSAAALAAVADAMSDEAATIGDDAGGRREVVRLALPDGASKALQSEVLILQIRPAAAPHAPVDHDSSASEL